MEPRPDVIVDFVFEEGLLYVAVQNIGTEPALGVKVSFDHPFRGLGGAELMPALGLFRNIVFLAPGRAIRTLVDSSAAYYARGEPERIQATITYSDRSGGEFSSTIAHDLSIYRDVAFLVNVERT